MGWITGAFQIAIMFQPICGYVLDVVGLRIGFAIFAIAWSVGPMLITDQAMAKIANPILSPTTSKT